LSLAGVGIKPHLKIQISFSNDDSFECYGGKTTLSNIISYRSTDDDFDFTTAIVLPLEIPSDVAGSRCFEIDNYDKIENCDVTSKLRSPPITPSHVQENNQGLERGYLH
jgi:hypothetical protein